MSRERMSRAGDGIETGGCMSRERMSRAGDGIETGGYMRRERMRQAGNDMTREETSTHTSTTHPTTHPPNHTPHHFPPHTTTPRPAPLFAKTPLRRPAPASQKSTRPCTVGAPKRGQCASRNTAQCYIMGRRKPKHERAQRQHGRERSSTSGEGKQQRKQRPAVGAAMSSVVCAGARAPVQRGQ